jgi:hypothetical protein
VWLAGLLTVTPASAGIANNARNEEMRADFIALFIKRTAERLFMDLPQREIWSRNKSELAHDFRRRERQAKEQNMSLIWKGLASATVETVCLTGTQQPSKSRILDAWWPACSLRVAYRFKRETPDRAEDSRQKSRLFYLSSVFLKTSVVQATIERKTLSSESKTMIHTTANGTTPLDQKTNLHPNLRELILMHCNLYSQHQQLAPPSQIPFPVTCNASIPAIAFREMQFKPNLLTKLASTSTRTKR